MSEHAPPRSPSPGTPTPSPARSAVTGLVTVVGFLVLVEFASGILQGYYTPIYPQIAEHLSIHEGDLNWAEAAQLVVSALCIPLLSRLADMIGHKRVLLISTAVTALGSWVLAFAPGLTTFIIGWAVQGAYVVWLPIEIALIHRRTRRSGRQELLTRRGAAVLVGALELSVIIGALASGVLVSSLGMNLLLAIPAMVVTAVFFVILLGIEQAPGDDRDARFDRTGLALVSLALVVLMAGLVQLRLAGPGDLLAWLTIAASVPVAWWFVRYELAHPEPILDVRMVARPAQWPIQLTAFLFGMPVLGAQLPLSTFAQADPDVRGYGLGAEPAFLSVLIGVYVMSMAVGAFSLPLTTRLVGGTRRALILSCLLVGTGYAMWLVLNEHTWQALLNMAVAGLGSGALVAALPAAAASAAPPERTGIATGLTNGTKTVGGAMVSAIFAIVLTSTGSLEGPQQVAPFAGYLTVWGVCSAAAFLAAVVLLAAPKDAFTGVHERPTVV